MPPKRKSTRGEAVAKAKPRQSKLAKEHNVTAQQESEIKEAFSLFAEAMEGEKQGVLPIGDLRSAMVALGIPPTKDELSEFVSILDPDSEGYASYDSFFAICALKFHQRDDDGSDDSAHRGELDEAFSLFTQGSATGTITLTHLKRVAALLKEEVAEELLRDMIQEANGGAGIGAGVRKEEFDDVMRRAGVWR